jgi:putative hemolysin
MTMLQSRPTAITSGKNLSPNLSRYTVGLARSAREVEEAQRLRYQVFFQERRAASNGAIQGTRTELDRDQYDADCEHLIVRDQATLEVVGCYRIMLPQTARKRGGFYSDSEFDLTRLDHLRGRMVEVGRACIHPDYRSGSVILLLWSGLARYVLDRGYDYAIGCASIDLADGHANAVSVFRDLAAKCLAPNEYRVFPKNPYPLRELRAIESLTPPRIPALLKGYVRLGAWLGGEPAWDPDFNTADVFTMLPIAGIPASYAKHFFAAAA